MKMRHMGKRWLSLLLAAAMVFSMMPAISLTATAATNVDGGLEGQEADVFSALGFDTSVEPEGYDGETVDNPYGRDKLAGNQIFEMLVSSGSGAYAAGKDDNSLGVSQVVGTSMNDADVPLTMFSTAAGDFDGDGLPGEAVYVGAKYLHAGYSSANLVMHTYDAATGSFSDSMPLATISAGAGTWIGSVLHRQTTFNYDYFIQNLMQVATGDFDGDGYAEIAVYVPASGNARVDVYKWMRDAESKEADWKDLGNWSVVWSHVLSNDSVPNMVSLLSADVDRDGIDDLGIAYGRYETSYAPGGDMLAGWTNAVEASKAVILWGDKTRMLQDRYAVDLCENSLGNQARVSLTAGDVNADGYDELIVTGQPITDLAYNTTRSVIVYTYDGVDALASLYCGNVKPVDGQHQTDENGTETWNSGNGFDDTYHSSNRMRTNAAVVRLEGYDYNYLYLDSCMYEYVEGSLTLKMALDDASYDGSSTLDATWLYPGEYMEYGAVAADLNGDGYDQLYVSYYAADSCMYEESSGSMYYHQHSHKGGFSGLQGSDGKLSVDTKSAEVSEGGQWTTAVDYETASDVCCFTAVPVDVDTDTTLIEYTGIHYLTYSDPQVLAIIAAAPYFEDVDAVSGYDYARLNTTSYSKISGTGDGGLVTVSMEAGAYYASTKVLSSFLVALETSVSFTMDWEERSSTVTEYTMTFQTSQDEDAVAFYSIPTENYVYCVSTPDGNGGYNVTYETISNTFQPVYQVLTLDYYESIRGDYGDALPAISGEALTSTPGDPGSYPSSSSGYKVIAEWNEDPAGVSFGNGSITQEITITEEDTETYNLGGAWDFRLGLGGKTGVAMGAVTEFEAQGGIKFSLNPAGGWTTIDIEGLNISGTVANMPLEFQDYGYYYNWKIFCYEYKFPNGASIPVISYIVNDVSEPPKLPSDFQQDVERTTSDTNILTWTYDGDYSSFIIYKHFDFPVGGGLQEVARYEMGQTPYILKYDENGVPYKEFYFADENLAAYAEYQYAIQVERLGEVPPLSSPSALLTARTKAEKGNPVNTIVESDGENDGTLLVYPDRNAYLTVAVTGPEGESGSGYYTTIQYQWQKKENGAWVDIDNETDKTLTIASAGSDIKGEYRCRVNALTKSDATAITSYTGSVSLKHSKRSTYFGDLYVRETTGGIELYAKVRNAHSDSGATPTGNVTFNLLHAQSGRNYQYVGELDTTGAFNEIVTGTLPAGTYTVSVTYNGSYIFKTCSGECNYLSQISQGYAIEAPRSVTYGDGAEVAFQSITKINGHAVATNTKAASVGLSNGETVALTDVTMQMAGTHDATYPKYGDMIKKGHFYAWPSDMDYGDDMQMDMVFYANVDGYFVGFDTYPGGGTVMLVLVDNSAQYLTLSASGDSYVLAENTPAGTYTIIMEGADGSICMEGIAVNPKAITLQLPTRVEKQDTNAAMGDITYGELAVVSGGWAACDSDENGQLSQTLAGISVVPSYRNTAGTAFNKDAKRSTCGYYAIGAEDDLANYNVTFRGGSLSIIGGSKPMNLGVREFEDQTVGTLYMVAPDYAYTRTKIGEDGQLTVSQAVGSRVVFTAVPDEGYQVYDWYVNGVAQGVTSTSFAYVMLNQEATVEVQFVFEPDTLIFGIAGETSGGKLECSDTGLTSGSIVIPNTYLTYTAQAHEGYHFKEWRYTELGKGTAYYTEDDGAMSSSFQLLMPTVSCSLYAVFEKDTYTFEYTDKNGIDGLTAWYWGSTTGDSTAGLEQIIINSGDQIPRGTQIVVQPRDGFSLDADYNYVSTGSQGTADYDAGTYTLTLEEDTHVTGYTVQHEFSVTLGFRVDQSRAFPEGSRIVCTIDGNEYVYDCPSGSEVYTISEIPGGSAVSVTVTYPDYYTFGGWEVNDTTSDAETFNITALGGDATLTARLNEKPVYTVTLADITGKGTYKVTLPAGAVMEGDVVTCHENDALTVQVEPATGYTVTYWQVKAASEDASWTTKASSLKYQFPVLTEDYTFTPIFASTTYHTISWPTLAYFGTKLTAEEGYLTTVSSGNAFKFTLSGGTYAHVVANGLEFVDVSSAAGDYPNVYETVNGVKVYTIRDITANQEVSVTNEAVTHTLTLDPAAIVICPGETVTVTVSYTGAVPTRYECPVVSEIVNNGDGTFTYTVPADRPVGYSADLSVTSYYGSTKLASVSLPVTVVDAVSSISVTCQDETPAQDGSYLLHPITPSAEAVVWDFDAAVTMKSGAVNSDVAWSVWGAQMRSTSIDSDGVLTVSPKEYGTNGTLKVIATYTSENGYTTQEEVLINLSTDAHVAYDDTDTLHGSIASITGNNGYVAGGSTVVVTAQPDENHAVANWYINGVAVKDDSGCVVDAQNFTLTFTAAEMSRYIITVEFTHYYSDQKHETEKHWMECSCGDKTGMEDHYDFDLEHNCDVCGYVLSVCADSGSDHKCDYCGETLSQCADDNNDHICDICQETVSECADNNGDHKCDVCETVLSECADGDKDHLCDVCGTDMGTHEAAEGKHTCDYCGEILSECADADRDHKCDICGEPTGDHVDENDDHNCDICGETVNQCADGDNDHICDICQETVSECADGDSNHKCDVCGTELSQCADDDSDHLCDICGEAVSGHKDDDSDHNCDICGEPLSECSDADGDGKCDLCGGDPCACVDEDNDHKCDACGESVSECADANGDNLCDTCGQATREVLRIYGANRFETAFKAADEMKLRLGVEKFDAIIIASGANFADALSGSYLANVKNAPILLSYDDAINADIQAYIQKNLKENGMVYILGGSAAVPESLDIMLESFRVKRLAGADRFETNLLILKEAGVTEGQEILVCTGTNFADSLSASATAQPILLVWNESGKLLDSQKDYLAGLDNGYCIIGGEKAVGSDIADAVKSYGEVERLEGGNRYETSVLVAERFFEEPANAVLAYAWNYPDGLCGGVLAYAMNAPLILTDSEYYDYAAGYIAGQGITDGVILGGTKLIDDSAVRAVFALEEADEIIVK